MEILRLINWEDVWRMYTSARLLGNLSTRLSGKPLTRAPSCLPERALEEGFSSTALTQYPDPGRIQTVNDLCVRCRRSPDTFWRGIHDNGQNNV